MPAPATGDVAEEGRKEGERVARAWPLQLLFGLLQASSRAGISWMGGGGEVVRGQMNPKPREEERDSEPHQGEDEPGAEEPRKKVKSSLQPKKRWQQILSIRFGFA